MLTGLTFVLRVLKLSIVVIAVININTFSKGIFFRTAVNKQMYSGVCSI